MQINSRYSTSLHFIGEIFITDKTAENRSRIKHEPSASKEVRCGARKWKSLGLFMICIPNEVKSMHSTHIHIFCFCLRIYFGFILFSSLIRILSFSFFQAIFFLWLSLSLSNHICRAKTSRLFLLLPFAHSVFARTRLWRFRCLRCLQWAAMMLLHSASTCFCWCMDVYAVTCE